MLSALCKAASAAAVLAVMLYYLTFMPYVISYACEAVLDLWEKIGIVSIISNKETFSVALRWETGAVQTSVYHG